LTLNEEATIGRCLDSIVNQRYPRTEFEIIVVDGHSIDRTREIAKNYNSEILLENKHTFGHARNLGVHSAKGKYIAFVSSDAWAEPDWLTNVHKAISTQETAGIVGKQIPITSTSWVSKIRSARFKETYSDESRRMGKGDNFSTVNCTYTRKAIVESGGFDESLPACEDQDLAHRILQNGLKIIYDPNVTVHHAAEESLVKICTKTFRQGIGEGVCNSRYQVWSGKLYLSILLLIALATFPLALAASFSRSLTSLLLGSLISLFLLVMTFYATRVFQETRDWRTFLGTYVYYPSVAIAELLGFLIGRLIAYKFPTVTGSPM